jgi:hypothetical protein
MRKYTSMTKDQTKQALNDLIAEGLLNTLRAVPNPQSQ